MTVRNAPSRHVRQGAKLVRRLNQLVPQLRVRWKATSRERDELVQWAREQMAQHTDQARPMQSEDVFLDSRTVEAYFALPEAERERIWDELYAAAIETAKEQEPKPDAVIPA